MKMELGIKKSDVLIKVNDAKLYNQSWLERKIFRYKLIKKNSQWRRNEYDVLE